MFQSLKKLAVITPLLLLLSILLYLDHISYGDAGLILATSIIVILLILKILIHKTISSPLNDDDGSSLFFNIMESLTDPLLLLDDHKTIIMANRSAKKMFGKNIVSEKISNHLHDTNVLSAIKHAIESGKSDTVEFKAGQPRARNYLLRIHVLEKVKASYLLSKNAGGRTIFLTIYDITSIKEAERMRVDFVANVSHELRTPLASILGFVETLQGPAKNDSDALNRFLKIMNDEASRMARLIEDLLSLSHIERDAHIPPEQNISLKRIIENVIEAMDIRLKKRQMNIQFSTEFETGNITGDRDQLTQVFQNLIDNAIKYGQQGTDITIEMMAHHDKRDNKEYIEVNVTNQGAGIAPEHIKRLTERFYRVDTARSRSLGGTGLGLAIVKHILQRHEGKLSFDSEMEKYTKATVLLPANSSSLSL